MQKFRRVTVALRDERNERTLKLVAEPFTVGLYEPRSGVYLEAVIQRDDNTRVKQPTIVTQDYWFTDAEDAEGTARIMIADFLETLASVLTSLRRPVESDLSAEWRAFVQSRANRLYSDAQRKRFAIDVLEDAARFGEYCALMRFVYLYFFVLFNSDAERLAAAIRNIAAALLDGNGRSFTFSVNEEIRKTKFQSVSA